MFGQHLLDLVERLATQIRGAQQICFGVLNQIADVMDALCLGRGDIGRDGDAGCVRGGRAPDDRRRGRVRPDRRLEHDVDEVVGRPERGGRVDAAAAVLVHTVRPVYPALQRVQGWAVDAGGGERGAGGVVADGGVIRGDVRGVGIDRDGRVEDGLLPAGARIRRRT